MKIKIKRKELEKKITKINYLITSSNTITLPILKNIKMEVLPEKIILYGSNSFSSIKVEMKQDANVLEIEKTGSILLPLKYIVELVRKIDGEFIFIEKKENQTLEIRDSKSEFIINTWDEVAYPSLIFDIKGTEMTFDPQIVEAINNEVVFAADNDLYQQNETLRGINFISDKKKMRFTATNSHRLAMRTIAQSDKEINVTLQPQVFKVFNKIFDHKNPIKAFISENKIIFKEKEDVIQFQNKQGQYPDVLKIVPESAIISLIINRQELIKALERINLILESSDKKVKMTIEDNKVQLATTQNQSGSVLEPIENFTKKGQDIEFICSTNYLLDSLRSFKTPEVKFEINTSTKPVLISNNKDKELIHLIMPIRSI